MMPQPTDNDEDEMVTAVTNSEGDTDIATDTNVSVDTEDTTDSDEGVSTDTATPDDEPETFPAEYVRELRTENARYREKAKTADPLAQRLHVALVAATGRLQDAEDLPFNESHLDDQEALTAAIDDLLERKPHLKSRRVVGDVGQGAGGASTDVDLAGILRGLA